MDNKSNKRNYIQKRLYIYHFLNDGITFILPTLMASFFIIFDLNWFQTGLIFAFNALGLVIFQILVGYYTDRHSEKLMKLGLFFLAFTSFLMIFSFNFISLLIFATLSGIALAFQHSISYSTTSRMYMEERNVKVGRQGAAGDVGKCVAVFSSAIIIILLGSWQIVLLVWAVIIFSVFGLILVNFRKINFEDYFHSEFSLSLEEDRTKMEKTSKFQIFIVVFSYVLYAAAYTMLVTNIATYLKVVKTGVVSDYSELILGYTILFGVLGAFCSGIFKNKLGMSNSMIFISLGLIPFILIYVSI
ncbi:MAG: MFS transporter, partial [Candidatus Lokiarchaeota archaeon]|nr:MFS transporter [Candidatus Lokiarchaeota archaeon]